MKYFLADVGHAQILEKVGGELRLFASANALTDSSLNFTSNMQEVRAGVGGKLFGRFNTETGMTVSLTNAMFDLKYIAGQVGAEIQHKGADRMVDAGAVFTDVNKVKLTKEIKPLGSDICGLDGLVVWYKKRDCQAGDMMAVQVKHLDADPAGVYTCTSGDFPGVSASELSDPDKYCVYYMQEVDGARSMKIGAQFNPKELVLMLTTNLYAGDSSSKETGKPIGHITIKIPRFQLDGQFDLSMAMSSASQIAMNGTALVTSTSDCEESGVYAEIVEVIEGRAFKLIGINVANKEELAVIPKADIEKDDIELFAIYDDGTTEQVDSADFTYDNTTGVVTYEGKTVTVGA